MRNRTLPLRKFIKPSYSYLIEKKRDGQEFTQEEIRYIIDSTLDGEMPQHQLAALLMAIFFQQMSAQETAILTEEMMLSGEVIDLSHISKPKIDKYSTGGVGDKTSLVLVPLAMASGVETWIASGKRPGVVTEILDGRGVGTRLQAAQADVLSARRRWIASLKPKGALHVDAGAVTALVSGKKSLLPSGIVKVEGSFAAGDAVRVVGPDGRDVARGLSAYAAEDTRKSLYCDPRNIIERLLHGQ